LVPKDRSQGFSSRRESLSGSGVDEPDVFFMSINACGSAPDPRVHGITVMVNSIFSGWRFDDARA
jgi:hypothetical protein